MLPYGVVEGNSVAEFGLEREGLPQEGERNAHEGSCVKAEAAVAFERGVLPGEGFLPLDVDAGSQVQVDMHPKKVTVLKGTGVELVTLFIIILAVTQHIYFTATVYVTELIFSVPRRLQIL